MPTPFDLILFQSVDPTGTVIEEQLNGRVRDVPTRLEHTTKLPGGFEMLSFRRLMTLAETERWIDERMVRHVKAESGQQVIWNGRVEDIEFEAAGRIFPVDIICYGYQYNLSDRIDFTDHNATGATIIQNLRDNNLEGTSLHISDDNSQMTAVTDTLTLNRNGLDQSRYETIRASDGVLAYDDTNGDPVDFAIWDNQVIYYQPRSPSRIDWNVTVNLDIRPPGFQGARRWRDTVNAADGRYSAGKAGFSENVASINKTTRREGIAGSTDIDATAATAARDLLLSLRAKGIIRGNRLRLSRIRDRHGQLSSLCNVRAGEVIRISDFFATANNLPIALNNRNTFVIVETRCVHDNANRYADFLELVLDLPSSADITNQLASGGIRG